MPRHFHVRLLLLGLACLLLLGACSPPTPAPAQRFNARLYFQGEALALAQAVDRKDADAIRKLIHDDGVNPDTILDDQGMPLIAWPIHARWTLIWCRRPVTGRRASSVRRRSRHSMTNRVSDG